jgi:regulatory protein spx
VALEEHHIGNDPPSRAELARIAAALPGGARDLLATRSRRFRELGLDADRLTDDELLDLLAREPRLLRRPILWDGRRAAVGAAEADLRRVLAD